MACLGKLILFGERSLRRAISEYAAHYHEERNHQGCGNRIPFPAKADRVGSTDGEIWLAKVAATGTSYEFVGEAGDDYSGYSVSSAGDVDGDGNDDLLIGAYEADDGGGTGSGSTYLIFAAGLAALNSAGGATEGEMWVVQVATTGTSYE
ncbi:MAG: hypothetical protein GY722_00990, partial [bacterium]|nr:hypothetical protein [bacterium]